MAVDMAMSVSTEIWRTAQPSVVIGDERERTIAICGMVVVDIAHKFEIDVKFGGDEYSCCIIKRCL